MEWFRNIKRNRDEVKQRRTRSMFGWVADDSFCVFLSYLTIKYSTNGVVS
jgi:hypothetical protein